jgi:hypothetical protein
MAGQNHEGDGLGQAKAAEEGLKWDYYDMDFSVHKSLRYHEKLCAFYGTWRDWIKIVSVVAGSGVFILLLAQAQRFAETFAAFVALWAILDYIIQPDKKAEKHCELRDRFSDLAIKITRSPKTEENYRDLAATRLEIEKAEPPCKRLIDLQARNEECRARGYPPEDIVPLSGWQRVFGYFATFGMRRLEDWKAARQRQTGAY